MPAALHGELKRKLGGDEGQADRTLRAWYLEVNTGLLEDEQPIAEDDFSFWRRRFAAWVSGQTASTPPGGSPAWERVLEELRGLMSSYDIAQWIRPCRVREENRDADGRPVLEVEGPQTVVAWIQRHYQGELDRAAERAGVRVQLRAVEAAVA